MMWSNFLAGIVLVLAGLWEIYGKNKINNKIK